jgi:hypothetical protein
MRVGIDFAKLIYADETCQPLRKELYVTVDNHISDYCVGGGFFGIRWNCRHSGGHCAGIIRDFSGSVFGVFDFKRGEKVKRCGKEIYATG